ncbi:hypothetical protein C0J52_13227 [Blattella germanica]|nr:hypothetical protein C0J52_13227 [Blattella germanica]
MNVLKKALLSYQQFLSKYPAPVQIVQTGILMGVGDIQSQLLFEDKTLKTLDKLRVLKFSALGFCFIGPVLCNWYKLLHVTVQGEPNIVTLKKVALDQIVAAPSLLLCVTSGISLLDGHSIQETKQILKDTYFTILLANYKVSHVILNFFT